MKTDMIDYHMTIPIDEIHIIIEKTHTLTEETHTTQIEDHLIMILTGLFYVFY